MTFKLDHWKNPRETIATNLRNHDMEYATHGAIEALKILKFTDFSIKQMANMTVLDYGCGTGRMARPLTALFKHVYAYDPQPECIREGGKECGELKFKNLTMTHDFNIIPEVDFAISISVIEHLSDEDAKVMISNLAKVVNGPTAILYSLSKNKSVMYPYLTDEQLEADAQLKIKRPESRISGNLVNFRIKHR
jgi:2-polyprenyl-3-methyl-5-hydroxy-6-metoxy-1,4-benzoquinol methylase